jgi:hypothetical protein
MEKSLDELLHVKREILNKDENRKLQKRKYIHKLVVVRKKTLYGLYLEDFIFIKAYLINPNDILKLASILEV